MQLSFQGRNLKEGKPVGMLGFRRCASPLGVSVGCGFRTVTAVGKAESLPAEPGLSVSLFQREGMGTVGKERLLCDGQVVEMILLACLQGLSVELPKPAVEFGHSNLHCLKFCKEKCY